jgi:hypothetical protein
MKNSIQTEIELTTGDIVEVEVYYVYEPPRSGVRYTANGDGWPDEPADVDIDVIMRIGDDDPLKGKEVSDDLLPKGCISSLEEEIYEYEGDHDPSDDYDEDDRDYDDRDYFGENEQD